MNGSENLKKMLDDLIDNKPEQAQMNFHNYLSDKMKEVMGTEKTENNDSNEE